jgi:hypothetical protein
MIITEKIEKEWDYLGGGPVIITNSINKTVLLPLCDNKCDWNKQKSVINRFTKIWQYVVSLIYCIDKNKKHQIHWITYFTIWEASSIFASSN